MTASPPSSGASQSPPPQPPPDDDTPMIVQYGLDHVAALVVTPLSLLVMALPPRRLNVRTGLLFGLSLWGADTLVRDYSGRSVLERAGARLGSAVGRQLPAGAQETQARLRGERERRARLLALRDDMVRSGLAPAPTATSTPGDALGGWTDDQKRALLRAYEAERREREAEAAAAAAGHGNFYDKALRRKEERKRREKSEMDAKLDELERLEKERARREEGRKGEQGQEKEQGQEEGGKEERGVLEKIWMGDAPPDWKEQRDKREKEALREGGGGYLGLITDQIAEVWRGKKTDEGDASKGKTRDDDDNNNGDDAKKS